MTKLSRRRFLALIGAAVTMRPCISTKPKFIWRPHPAQERFLMQSERKTMLFAQGYGMGATKLNEILKIGSK